MKDLRTNTPARARNKRSISLTKSSTQRGTAEVGENGTKTFTNAAGQTVTETTTVRADAIEARRLKVDALKWTAAKLRPVRQVKLASSSRCKSGLGKG